jgi:hypothetical protein
MGTSELLCEGLFSEHGVINTSPLRVRITDTLLNALDLQPGNFART